MFYLINELIHLYLNSLRKQFFFVMSEFINIIILIIYLNWQASSFYFFIMSGPI
jgi:hypothetical protein